MIAATIGRSVSSDIYCLFGNASRKGLLLRTALREKKRSGGRKGGEEKKEKRKSGEYVRVAQTVTASITKVVLRFLNRRAR